MPNDLGTSGRPLRVGIVGSGPSAFYAADFLFKSEVDVVVNMFEKLPLPFGLVRYGVAPDHYKIKNVIKIYEKIADHPDYEFFGNVEIGKDISVHQLGKYYDAIIFAYGAETDRRLGVVGEDLKGSHTATEFVAWYNGRPEFQDREFDLSCEDAVIIGQGNVALDVARILCKTVDELKETDITQNALAVLAESKIKRVHVIGRRGPAQAAFTPVEIREFGELANCAPIVNSEDLELNYASQIELEDPKNTQKKKNYEILKNLTLVEPENKEKRFILHFCKSPVALYGTENCELDRVYLELNTLVGEPGAQKSKGSGEKERLNCGILFRSVGYRGLPLEGAPYEERRGTIPNQDGRVMDSEHIYSSLYATGWIKRGASGIIGTNKADSSETVKSLLEDLKGLNPCKTPDTDKVRKLLKESRIDYVLFEDWKKIDVAEIERGEKVGKPREKFTNVDEMLNILSESEK